MWSLRHGRQGRGQACDGGACGASTSAGSNSETDCASRRSAACRADSDHQPDQLRMDRGAVPGVVSRAAGSLPTLLTVTVNWTGCPGTGTGTSTDIRNSRSVAARSGSAMRLQPAISEQSSVHLACGRRTGMFHLAFFADEFECPPLPSSCGSVSGSALRRRLNGQMPRWVGSYVTQWRPTRAVWAYGMQRSWVGERSPLLLRKHS